MKIKPINITAYGTDSFSYEYALSEIEMVLANAEIPYVIERITEVSQFVKENLKSIPAFKVEDDIYCLSSNGTFNNSLKEAILRILKKRNFGLMKKIIIPIDFSDNSINAFMYGLRYAKLTGALPKAVHVYFPNSRDYFEASKKSADFEQLRKEYLDDLVDKASKEWASDFLETAFVDKEFRIGFPGEEILVSAKENDAELIIMGTTGDSSRIKKWFGSVSTQIIDNSEIPILLIPEKAGFSEIKQVMFAFNDQVLDRSTLNDIVNFMAKFDAFLHIVHVGEKGNKVEGNLLQSLIKDNFDQSQIKLSIIDEKDVSEGLINYAEKNEIDVISMSTVNRKFIQNLFHKSTTKQMSRFSSKPLLIFK